MAGKHVEVNTIHEEHVFRKSGNLQYIFHDDIHVSYSWIS